MSWLIRRRNANDESSPDGSFPSLSPEARPSWARRLGRVGLGLDAMRTELQGISITCDGGPDLDWAWVNAMAWRKTRYHEKWVNLTLRVNAGIPYEFRATGEERIAEPLPPDPASLAPVGPWARRYEAVGALLDAVPGTLSAPSIIDLGDSVLVSALGWERTSTGQWGIASFGYTSQHVQAQADAIAEARNQLAATPEKKR